MKTIQVNLTNEIIPCHGSYKDDWGMKKEFDSFKIKRMSGQRIYITTIKNNIRMTEIAKKMILNNGIVSIKIGSQEHEIGTYEEV